MKPAALTFTALAAALLIAALVQASALHKRLAALPAPVREAIVSTSQPAPATMTSPYEMAELAKRVEAMDARLTAKIDKETKELKAAQERFSGVKARSEESLVALERESAALKDALGDKADKTKVAEATKRIKTEQQKAMFKKFMAGEMQKENDKLKAELELTPDQANSFDKIANEMLDKFAEAGSGMMDGEANMGKFMELVTENNTKMATVLDEGQMAKYKEYQQKRFGGGGRKPEGEAK